ncbi:MAG: hypothetical protein DCC68_21300 [Planctomycetota bacterium]|nr:MAG: hypothetical protein DCC68_21300 [Planctomycetota bacterium]
MSTTLITLGETAEALGISPKRLGKLVREGKIPHVKLPDNEVRFDERDLLVWIESHKAGQTTAAEATS